MRWDATREVRIVNSWDYFDADEMDWGLGLLKRSGIIQFTIHSQYTQLKYVYLKIFIYISFFKNFKIYCCSTSLSLPPSVPSWNQQNERPCQDPIIQCQMLYFDFAATLFIFNNVESNQHALRAIWHGTRSVCVSYLISVSTFKRVFSAFLTLNAPHCPIVLFHLSSPSTLNYLVSKHFLYSQSRNK